MQVHPGAVAALNRMLGDELTLAEMIRDGEATSPQYFGNLALFKVRVSGVGYAYRPKLDEFVYRRPENYLSDRFLRRCNGLEVVWEHPDGAVLNSDEFADRIVGTVFLPFIENNEVWAIAKIRDQQAAQEMAETQLSTSPSVVFRDPTVNFRIELDDGSSLLVEGSPTLLDHLAICKNGVWDKGDDPTGVVTQPASDRDDLGEEAVKALSERIDAIADQVQLWRIHEALTARTGVPS